MPSPYTRPGQINGESPITERQDPAAGTVSDAAYGAGWDAVTTIAPSKNAVRDKIETLVTGPAFATDLAICIFDGTTGKLIKVALVTIDASGNILLPGAQEVRFRDANAAIWSSASTALRIKGTAIVSVLTDLFQVTDAAFTGARFRVIDVVGTVNYLQIEPSATGNAVIARINGTDVNRSFNVIPAGTGRLQENGANVPRLADPLSQFAATTSLQLLGMISDETGSGALVFATSPTLVTPTLGAASATSITGLSAPSGGSDAANKDYVDALANGLDWKASVRVATTAAGVLATDFENLDTIDGVVLATGDRILLKNQTAGAENGIYVVAASGAPARSADANVSAEVTSGMSCLVSEGTANADKVFVLTTNDPITLGTTALVFTQLAGGSYTHPNHTGPITSTGDGATAVASQTGSGSTFVMNTSPTLVTPVLGVASCTSLATSAASPLLLTNDQLVTIALTAQTIGPATLIIPDLAGAGASFLLSTLNQVISGIKIFNDGKLKLAGNTSGNTILKAAAVAGATTLTLPGVTDTIAVLGTAQNWSAAQLLTIANELQFRATTNRLYSNAIGELTLTAPTLVTIGAAGATITLSETATLVKKAVVYNNVTTAGWGIPAIYAAGRATAQTAANASVATYTVGAADGSFQVSANVLVTTATTHNFTVTCTYTDEGNTARTLTFNFSSIAGVLATAIINTGGAVPYQGVPLHIRCKAATAITIKTTGTFTTVTYNVEGLILQTA